VCRWPPVGCSLCRASTSAAAADPSASLQGGLEREAAVGRRRRESAANAGIKGAPSSPRSSSVRRVGSKAVPTSSVLATRQPTRDALGGGIGNVFPPLNVIGSPPGKYQTCGCVYEPPPAPAPATAVLRGAAPSSRSTLITSASRASRPRKSAAPCSGAVAPRIVRESTTPRQHAPRQAVASLGACHGSCLPTPRGLRSFVAAAARRK